LDAFCSKTAVKTMESGEDTGTDGWESFSGTLEQERARKRVKREAHPGKELLMGVLLIEFIVNAVRPCPGTRVQTFCIAGIVAYVQHGAQIQDSDHGSVIR
jgi:hypothetical protein